GMNVVIMGGGMVGQGALSVLHALGANVTVMDINPGLLRTLGNQYNNLFSKPMAKSHATAAIILICIIKYYKMLCTNVFASQQYSCI
ncbi:MAG: NAD-binding protein, partial [Bacteroidaceae bacterium]|nr:NAD-binding protein [Bacteroidaceae bacterium]